MNTSPSSAALIAAGRRALEIESRAVAELQQRVDDRFARACQICLAATGRVVVSGLGKSGHVAHKIAATLASTGTPAFFLHAAEASHGDLGMVTRGDVLLVISNSGETPELLALLPPLRRLMVPVIALTGRPDSTLAREATLHLDVSVREEACPLNLAPTASTTAALAMGDALATALLEARGFTSDDFARAHPGGALGRKLLLHVSDVMRRGDDLPRVAATAPLEQGLLEMSRKGLGMTAVVETSGALAGIFTDGDLRRALDKGVDLRTTPMHDVMTRNPRHIAPQELAAEAVNRMQEFRITALLVVDGSGQLAGALNIHDLLRAGVV
ncbi:MAG TPA: KpsF/GutQ family sugar-phosphate isomerase [Steroidobacteraceae bacterium]|nr:KpsF/GutQ family sugar-phosphate isomerase [Steroidobacteraceae bacterium]